MPLVVPGQKGLWVEATVTNGRFEAGPFADYGPRDEIRDPAPGQYILVVTTARPKYQPP